MPIQLSYLKNSLHEYIHVLEKNPGKTDLTSYLVVYTIVSIVVPYSIFEFSREILPTPTSGDALPSKYETH